MIKKIIISVLVLLFAVNFCFGTSKIFNVKDYGAKGDGKNDDYYSILKTVKQINAEGGGEIFFPQGVYCINRYHGKGIGAEDIKFLNCNGLKICGNNATILLKGNFNRNVTRKISSYLYSDISAIMPLVIENCRNVLINGLEIDGNVDEMTRDKDVIENNGHLIYINNSHDVFLKDLTLHYAQSDGIYICGGSSNVKAENVLSSNNARQGMSIIELINGKFDNCKFINTGITNGKYGYHAPGAGVDIEPHNKCNSVSNITFNQCTFENNSGSQFVASHVNTSLDIFLKGCTFVCNKDNSSSAIVINTKNVVFDSCYFSLQGGNIYPVSADGSSSIFKNCTIKTDSRGFEISYNYDKNSSVSITDCTIEYIGTKPMETYMPYIQMVNMEFVNNKIIIPEQYYRKDTPVNSLIQYAKKVKGNKYYSNGKLLKSPRVSYAKSKLLD